MPAAALDKAKSADPKKGRGAGGHEVAQLARLEVFMRPVDHSLFQDMYICTFGSGTKHDEEKTGWGRKMVGGVKAQDTVIPTTCKMVTPSQRRPSLLRRRRVRPAHTPLPACGRGLG
ncbi:MAG: hypothetical protein U1F49_15625 [Rubrivivax sp.]